MVASRKFAVFDIDGTLIRWQLYHAVVDALVHAGHIDAGKFQDVRAARMSWKQRAHETSFKTYEHSLVRLYDEAITAVSYDDFMAAVRAVFNEYKDQTYTYTRDLIRLLKQQGYLLFAISASQAEIVTLLADYYGFDDSGGSQYELKSGRFTGQATALRRERKPQLLQEFVARHGATFEGSIGIGDSDSDIPLLTAVEWPIAFNPDTLLLQHARSQSWNVVIERKNVVYELELENGGYKLAKTNV